MEQERIEELAEKVLKEGDMKALLELLTYLIKLDKDIQKKIDGLSKLMTQQTKAPKRETPYIS